MKKLLSVITMILLLVVVLATTVNAAEIVASGTCGGNLTWELDSSGTLTISGTGDMQNFYSYSYDQWQTKGSQIKKVVVKEGVTSIGNYAFRYSAATEVSLPSTLTKIGEGAFYGCSKLTQIQIPQSVEGKADKWFVGCKNLKEVDLPSGIDTLYTTFKNCTALESVSIPAATSYITFDTFDGCDSITQLLIDPNNESYSYENGLLLDKSKTVLEQVLEHHTGVFTVPENIKSIALYAFSGCDLLTEVRLPKNLETIETATFRDCTGLKKVVVQNGVRIIEECAFENCTALEEINIPDGVESIGYNAFYNCAALKKLEIPDSVKTLGSGAFRNCKGLETLILPGNLERVEDELFYGCESLRQLVIPESVLYFGDTVFYGTYNLEQVFFLGDAPQYADKLFYEYVDLYKDVTVYHLEDAAGWQGSTWSGAALDTWAYTLSGTANCTQPGTLIYTDTAHNLVYTKNVAQGKHLWSEPFAGKYPTTQEDGFWARKCSRCGKQEQFATIPKYVAIAQRPVTMWNASAQNYSAAADVVKSYLEPTDDGGYVCIQRNYISYYDKDFQFLRSFALASELPIFGGYYNDGTYRYIVEGQTNYSEDNNKEVIRVIRYTQDWLRIDSVSLYGANTTVPFDFGSLRMTHSGNMLYIRTSHEMYETSDGKNHQANMTLTIHIPTMRITTAEVLVANNPSGYVSHSFNQFIQTDGQDLLAVDHGDAYPRAIVLQRNKGTAGKLVTTGKCDDVNVLEIYGKIGANQTGASVGGFEISGTSYLVAGNSIVQDGTMGLGGQRNIFVTATAKSDFSKNGTSIVWLTNYPKDSDRTVSTPHLVKVNEDTFAVLWKEAEGRGYHEGLSELKLAYVDKNGQWDGKVYTAEGELSDCKPIVIDGRIVWYTAYNTYSDDIDPEWKPEFYEIRPEDPTKILADHNLYYLVYQKPTAQSEGALSIYCHNDCYHCEEVTMPALSEADYTCQVISQTDCANPGKQIYTWKDTTYGTISWEVTSQAQGHNWVDATCTAPKTCSVCGATEGSTLSHNWQAATCLKPKTCRNCGATEGGTLSHNWQAATCVKPKTCSICGATTGKTGGHTYTHDVDGTCNSCGVHRENVEARKVVHMFRMYNPNTGEHFYTGSTVERDNLTAVGWQYEGVGFTFPANTGAPVHRLFQPSTGEHLYTMSDAEKEMLEADGWNYEGIAFNSAYDTEAVQHRLHNPNAKVGAYHFTFSLEEVQTLINAGWEYQGIGWYSCWK